jgi:hypothetical protein
MRVDLESPIMAISEGARARVTVDGCMGRYGQWLVERRSESKGGPFRVWGVVWWWQWVVRQFAGDAISISDKVRSARHFPGPLASRLTLSPIRKRPFPHSHPSTSPSNAVLSSQAVMIQLLPASHLLL